MATNFISANALKNVVQELVRECVRIGIFIEHPLPVHIVNLLRWDPENGYDFDKTFNQAAVEKFVYFCAAKLHENQLAVRTLSLQALFENAELTIEAVSAQFESGIDEKLKCLTGAIVRPQTVHTVEEQESLYASIAEFIMAKNGFEMPAKRGALNETVVALKSILSVADLKDMVRQNRQQKIRTLRTIASIVCGIRVFNRDAGHYNEGVIDIVSLLEKSADSIKEMLQVDLENLQVCIRKVTNAATLTHDNHPLDDNDDANKTLELLRNWLIIFHQKSIYVRSLHDTIYSYDSYVAQKRNAFQSTLAELHSQVMFRTAIPTEKIFPLFEKLSVDWWQLQQIVLLISEMNSLLDKLTAAIGSTHIVMSTANQILDGQLIKDGDSEVAGMRGGEFAYRGFCTIALWSGEGLLLPADEQVSTAVYNMQSYAFRSAESLRQFNLDPEKIVCEIRRLVRNKPELIKLLDMYDEIRDYRQLTPVADEKQTVHDQSVQTELHPIPFCKVKDNAWNLWELRREAIRLANMRGKKTTSAQTTISYHRTTVDTQTWAQKTQSVQTKKDSSTGN